jgi:2,4-dienoyl-CoA reductase (NADPH2)
MDTAGITSEKPDVVVVATGAKVAVAEIPGAHQSHVFNGYLLRQLMQGEIPEKERHRFNPFQRWLFGLGGKILSRFAQPLHLRWLTRIWMPLGKRVAVIGSDLAAVELAEFLAVRGRKVYLLDKAERLAPEVGKKRRAEHMHHLDGSGVVVNTGVEIREITPRGVLLMASEGHSREVAVNSVIIAGEPVKEQSLYDSIREELPGVDTYCLGDATGLGLIVKAVNEAAEIAHQI